MGSKVLPVWLVGCVLAAVAQAPNADPTARPANAITLAPADRLPPMPQSPVEYFRHLLAMNAADRQRELAGQPATPRKNLEAKLREYDRLNPAERERRLRAVEVRWELLVLMKTVPANRAALLNAMQPADRNYVAFRLREWDTLPAAVQNEILENETTVLYFLRLESNTPAARENALQSFSPADRKQLEAKLSRWRALPPGRRAKMLDRFTRFFELTTDERQNILGALPEAQRRQTEQTLKTIEELPKDQRRRVLQSLRKFADMTSTERAQFFQNAARWEALPSREREAWLNLVELVPPLPPGLEIGPPLPPGLTPLPPMPPLPASQAAAGATN